MPFEFKPQIGQSRIELDEEYIFILCEMVWLQRVSNSSWSPPPPAPPLASKTHG